MRLLKNSVASLLVLSLVYPEASIGQADLARSQQALKMIEDFAKSMCADPTYAGSTTTVAANAKAKVEVSNLVKKLADAKIELGAEARKDSFQGLLQKDLLRATENATTCRLTIFNDLKGRLLPAATDSGGSSGTTTGSRPSPSDKSPSPPARAKTVSYLPSVVLGATKSEFTQAHTSSLTWNLSTDKPPLEYTTLRTSLSGRQVDAQIFFSGGKVAVVKAIVALESSDYRSEYLGVLRGPRRQEGLTPQTYSKECERLRDEVYSYLSAKQSPEPGSMDDKKNDDTAAVERTITERPIRINQASTNTRKGVFASNETFAKIDFSWSDQRWDYVTERPHTPSPLVSYARYFSCSLTLLSREA